MDLVTGIREDEDGKLRIFARSKNPFITITEIDGALISHGQIPGLSQKSSR